MLKDVVFARHSTAVIGLKKVNANANTKLANDNFARQAAEDNVHRKANMFFLCITIIFSDKNHTYDN